jgi:hypothetical protein
VVSTDAVRSGRRVGWCDDRARHKREKGAAERQKNWIGCTNAARRCGQQRGDEDQPNEDFEFPHVTALAAILADARVVALVGHSARCVPGSSWAPAPILDVRSSEVFWPELPAAADGTAGDHELAVPTVVNRLRSLRRQGDVSLDDLPDEQAVCSNHASVTQTAFEIRVALRD